MTAEETVGRLRILVGRKIGKLSKYVWPTHFAFEAGDIWVAQWMHGSLWSCY